MKTDAYFYAWCYVTGRFKGDLRVQTLYQYFSKEDINAHVARIRKAVGMESTKDDLFA